MARHDAVRSGSSELLCRICEEWLHRHVEGEVDAFTSRSISGHLAGCPSCSALHRRLLEETTEFLEAALVSPPLSSRFPERVTAEIRRLAAEKRDRRLIRGLFKLGIGGSAAAAALIAAFLWGGWGAGSGGGGPLGPPSALLARSGAPLEASPERPVSRTSCPSAAEPGPAIGRRVEGTDLSDRAALIPAVDRLRLADSIDFSATFLKLEDRLPCSRDVNHDGETDVSDAAHLFMLAVASPPADLARYPSAEESDPDCLASCRRAGL
jgi:hypothetical protein